MSFIDTMPRGMPKQFHAPARTSDRESTLRKAKHDGFDAIDINTRRQWCLHWPDPKRNGYTHIQESDGRLREMTDAELKRPDVQWSDDDIARWRDEDGNHPLTYRQALARCKALGIKHPVFELKVEITAELAAQMVADARQMDMAPWFKGLVWLHAERRGDRIVDARMARVNCEHVIRAGGQFALIFGDQRQYAKHVPEDWAKWKVKPTRVWGPDSAKDWPGVGPGKPLPAPKPEPTPVPTPEPKPTPAPKPEKPVKARTVVDYSFARPSPAALHDAGFRLAMRYISNGSKKDLTASEARALHAAGLDIALVWETVAGRAGEGARAGTVDVQAAEAAADRLGYPKDAVIFYAVDFDATAAQVEPFFRAVTRGAKRPVGVYGGV